MNIKRKRSLLLLLTVACCAVLPSCAPPQVYVTADRETFNAVAPEYRAYVEADANLSDVQKERRYRTIDTWQSRVEAAEGAAK